MTGSSLSAGNRVANALLSLIVVGALGALALKMQTPPRAAAPAQPSIPSVVAVPDNKQLFTPPQLPQLNPNSLTTQNPAFLKPGALPGTLPGIQLPNGQPSLLSPPNMKGDPKLMALWQKAMRAQGAGNLSEAAAGYRELLRASPKAVPAHVNLALVLMRQKDEKQAIWHLRQAISLAPKEVQPRIVLAQSFMFLKQPREAFDQWAQLATMAKTQSNMKPMYIQAAVTAGALAFGQLKDLPAAETWFRSANDALESRDPRTALTLAQVLNARQKPGEAIKVLQAAAKQSPKIIEIKTALVQSQLAAKDRAGAIATLRTLETQIPASQNNGLALSQIRVMLGRTLTEQKEYSAAAVSLQSALALLPKNSPAAPATRFWLAQTFASQANALEKDKKLEEAIATWSRAASVLPQNPLAYLQRGRLLQKTGKDDEALREYRRALQFAPNEANALLQVAQLSEKTGNDQQASKNWQNLIGARPDYKPAYFGLMRLAAKQRRLSQQMQWLETRAAKTPDERAIYDSVLLVSEREGKLEAARNWVEALSKKYPNANAPRAALRAFSPKTGASPAPTPNSTPSLGGTSEPPVVPTPYRTQTLPAKTQSKPPQRAPRIPTIRPTAPEISPLPTATPKPQDAPSNTHWRKRGEF